MANPRRRRERKAARLAKQQEAQRVAEQAALTANLVEQANVLMEPPQPETTIIIEDVTEPEDVVQIIMEVDSTKPSLKKSTTPKRKTTKAKKPKSTTARTTLKKTTKKTTKSLNKTKQ